MNFPEPDIGGPFHPELKLRDSKDYNLPCNLICFLEAGPMCGCDLGYCLRMPREVQEVGGHAETAQQKTSTKQANRTSRGGD